ncbi:MAG: UDP-2,3-diacylglucosamine diphosphatase [Flammeovirgaceae bacterium]|jgi:UDP-2,3-diacylglucosamine hydrolase
MERIQIKLKNNKKAYFAGDFHLGIPNEKSSMIREKKIIKWLDSIENHTQELFLMGDIFDFWFEYKYVVPKYYFNFLSKISNMIDNGINVHFFKGNHDMWTLDYFENIGLKVYDNHQSFKIDNSNIMVGHGDGLGKGDRGYKVMKSIFKNRATQFMFRILHPDIGIKLGTYLSKSNKNREDNSEKNNNRIYNFCKDYNDKESNKAYIFGHSHKVSIKKISNSSTYFNTGEWLNESSYLELDSDNFKLKKF